MESSSRTRQVSRCTGRQYFCRQEQAKMQSLWPWRVLCLWISSHTPGRSVGCHNCSARFPLYEVQLRELLCLLYLVCPISSCTQFFWYYFFKDRISLSHHSGWLGNSLFSIQTRIASNHRGFCFLSAPVVSIHPDKFIQWHIFSLFFNLCCMGSSRMTVLFMCSLRCTVCSNHQMESKAADKMEPPKARHHMKLLFLHNKEELGAEHSFTSILTHVITFYILWEVEQAFHSWDSFGTLYMQSNFYLLFFD